MQLKRITQIAYENGDYGADKWLQHHEKIWKELINF
jgi:hypothetical protein